MALGGCVPREIPNPPKAGGFAIVSDSFAANSAIPAEFTCDGANTQPALRWSHVPAGTKSLALLLRDPDAPSGDFLHWAVTDIPAGAAGLEPGVRPPAPARELQNDAGINGYTGPCPPSGTHRYIFTLYALKTGSFEAGRGALQAALEAGALGKASLTGLYRRKE